MWTDSYIKNTPSIIQDIYQVNRKVLKLHVLAQLKVEQSWRLKHIKSQSAIIKQILVSQPWNRYEHKPFIFCGIKYFLNIIIPVFVVFSASHLGRAATRRAPLAHAAAHH